ncbi:SDR family oxidoreductase [Marinomonas sp. C2222]|uniref:SDR family oxidoreductase n=1 Tax=Marinomonas sargassi TaxID=2984494 RepID=A0ABT2YUD4_9GAMM|nr:SDR family oxidoreductase [Marinomonas sargassi]MCV2403513.1 SDR family oxidoreductase [Marinomonas sargassi]
MLQKLDFRGKTALIMGASRGIGLATAQILSQYGATVVLAARSSKVIEEGARKINEQGGHAYAIPCDVSDYGSIQHCVDKCLQQTGKIDFLINVAGVIEPLAHLIDSDPEQWALAADINYKGVYFCMRAVLPHMLNAGGGIIVNMSSGAANSALHGWSHYCSSKSAAKKLTEVAHNELHERNIRVVGLSPGTVATGMMEDIREAKINVVSDLDWSVHISPESAAEGVAFLCGSEGAEFAGMDFSIKTAEGRKRVGLAV